MILVEKVSAESLKNLFNNFDGSDKSKTLGSFVDFVDKIVIIAISLAGIVATLFFLYGCFLYMTSFGDDTKAETAKKTILYSLLGVALIIIARVIVKVINGELLLK